jgi:hypothetical protein
MSVTSDLPTVQYVAEIVGWDDKRQLGERKRAALNRLIWTLQPKEGGLYDAARAGGQSVNLLHVRRVRKLATPFSVARLVNVTDGEFVSDRRATAGGWVYVKVENLAELIG